MICAQTHGLVDIFGAGNAAVVEIGRFVNHGNEDAVDDKAGVFLDEDGILANGAGDFESFFDRFIRAGIAANDFDQLHDRGRVEEMKSHKARFVLKAAGHFRDGEGRSVAAEEAILFADLVELFVNGAFRFHIFKDGLDHHVDLGRIFDLERFVQTGQRSIRVFLRHALFFDLTFELFFDHAITAINKAHFLIEHVNFVSVDRKRLCDSGTHGATAGEKNFHAALLEKQKCV